MNSKCKSVIQTVVPHFIIELHPDQYENNARNVQPLFVQHLLGQLQKTETIEEFSCEKCNMSNINAHRMYLIENVPNTIIIQIKRFNITNNIITKNHALVIPEEEIVLENCKYILQSAVLHHGEYENGGHYTALRLIHYAGVKYVQYCDDEMCTTKLFSDIWDNWICKTVYLLFYTKCGDSIFENTLKCLFSEELIIHLLSLLQKDTTAHKFIKDIQCYNYEKCKESIKEFKKPVNGNSVTDYVKFLAHILSCSDDGIQISVNIVDCFCTRFTAESYCDLCDVSSMKEHEQSFINCNKITDIVTAVQAMSSDMCTPCPSCKQEDTVIKNVIICSLPEALTLYFSSCLPTNIFDNEIVDLSYIVNNQYPFQKVTYVINGMIFHNVNEADTIVTRNSKGQWFSQDNVKIAKKEVVLFWDKFSSCTVFLKMLNCSHLEYTVNVRSMVGLLPRSPFSIIYESYFDDTQISLPTTFHGFTINQEMVNIILSKRWFTSSIVDCYMYILSLSSMEKKVLTIPSGWIKSKLFYNDLERTREFFNIHTRNSFWDYNYIIIPECVHRHWIMTVVDINNYIVYICDSFNKQHKLLACQILRYLAYHMFSMLNTTMETARWKIAYFASADKFPIQKDHFSCGPYICNMAKSIIQGRKFKFISTDARKSIAMEIGTQLI